MHICKALLKLAFICTVLSQKIKTEEALNDTYAIATDLVSADSNLIVQRRGPREIEDDEELVASSSNAGIYVAVKRTSRGKQDPEIKGLESEPVPAPSMVRVRMLKRRKSKGSEEFDSTVERADGLEDLEAVPTVRRRKVVKRKKDVRYEILDGANSKQRAKGIKRKTQRRKAVVDLEPAAGGHHHHHDYHGHDQSHQPSHHKHHHKSHHHNEHDGPRTQFHEQGLHGPHSYRFGFDTADPHNRQTRYEESDSHGVVKGHYSYMDPHGKLKVVHYEAHPKYGFRTREEHQKFADWGHH